MICLNFQKSAKKPIVQRRKWKADGHACVGCSKIIAGTRRSHWSYQVISTFSLSFFFRIFHSWWYHRSYRVISTSYFIPSYLLWFQCWNRSPPKWSCHPRWSQLECLGTWSSNFQVLRRVKHPFKCVILVQIQMIWLVNAKNSLFQFRSRWPDLRPTRRAWPMAWTNNRRPLQRAG